MLYKHWALAQRSLVRRRATEDIAKSWRELTIREPLNSHGYEQPTLMTLPTDWFIKVLRAGNRPPRYHPSTKGPQIVRRNRIFRG